MHYGKDYKQFSTEDEALKFDGRAVGCVSFVKSKGIEECYTTLKINKFKEKGEIKMKKIIALLLGVLIFLPCFSCSDKNLQNAKGELTLNEYTWITYTSNGKTIKSFLDFATEEEKDTTEVFAISKDDSIVKVEENTLKTNKKFGTTTVEIYTNDKTATLEVQVVSTIDYLRHVSETNKYYETDYLACIWLIKNMDDFKKPSSVEIADSWYWCHKNASGNIDYFIMKTRAENSFGGNTIDYTRVEYKQISEGSSPFLYGPILLDGFTACSTYYIEKALDEYKKGLKKV